MNLVSPNSISSVEWMQGSLIAQQQQSLTWHKVQSVPNSTENVVSTEKEDLHYCIMDIK